MFFSSDPYMEKTSLRNIWTSLRLFIIIVIVKMYILKFYPTLITNRNFIDP